MLAVDAAGRLAHRAIYFIPHANPRVTSVYNNLAVLDASSNSSLLLRASPRHFIPATLDGGATWAHSSARDVPVGAHVKVVTDPANVRHAVMGHVLAVTRTLERGQYNPFVEVRRGRCWAFVVCQGGGVGWRARPLALAHAPRSTSCPTFVGWHHRGGWRDRL